MIALDSHKHYTFASVQDEKGRRNKEGRIPHQHGAIKAFLEPYEPGTSVAVESIGSWYWIVDEIEAAHMEPKLVHARKAKLMMGMINKTDKLDARGLNRLQQNGTLPTVWIAPADIRDKRELPRTRMVFAQQRTRLKNRIHSVIDKYGLQDQFEGISDIFGRKGRGRLQQVSKQLPTQTRYTLRMLLRELDGVQQDIDRIERRIKQLFMLTPEFERLMTIPGVGFILAVVILLEVGDITRFPSAPRLAGYSGTTPSVHSSGGKTRYGRLRKDTNHYLKWAFSEAANSIAVNRNRFPDRHVSQLYNRIRKRKNHAIAVGAVSRHLAEATYYILSKGENYRERGLTDNAHTEA
jgi:transposase